VEEPASWRFLSGRTNLEYFARAGGVSADRRARLGRVADVLERVGLADAADKKVRAYSQGMRQRLGIALALLGRPELLVLDEPTNGLDPTGMREMRGLLRDLADGGTTVFVSSHLLAEVEAMCDRVGVMARGRLVAEGPPGTLRGAVASHRLEVDDPVRAIEILRTMPGIAAEVVPGGIRVRSEVGAGPARAVGSPADVNAALVAAGVRVSALMPERDTLEDAFLTLVEGADVPR
jgi:ABC-2 type transport system ATP-binding protein